MSTNSRIPGFYRGSIEERRALIAKHGCIPLDELEGALDTGGLTPDSADKTIENVLGTYALPFAVALNVTLNGRDHLVPMVVEEPSVVAAASNAARMVRSAGGFQATSQESLMTTQVQLSGIRHPQTARAQLEGARGELLEEAAAAVPNLVRRGGGPRSMEVRDLGEGMMVVHLHVDCQDAMGANLVNTIAEAVGPRISEIAGGRLGLRILTNLCDRRRVQVTAQVNVQALVSPQNGGDGQEIAEGIEQASLFAEKDPYRAATHNKGVMNGIDSVVMATGNDYRAVEAGVHAFAARNGRYEPVATWRRRHGLLEGRLDVPLSLGIVGGTLRVHPAARLALKLSGVQSAVQLAQLAAAVGLASNLAALRALATDGIQKGHMALHARSVAVAAGAVGREVDLVARTLAQSKRVTVQHGEQVLAQLREDSQSG